MTATSTLPKADQKKIADFLKGRHIPVGLGTKSEACSIAAINLALTGTLSDTIPDCMSRVIGKWIIRVQDAMPDELRNSAEWKRLLPLAAGTGRDFERERRAVILDWMWGTVLPTLQPIADKRGYGPEWLAMTTGRTYDLATAAKASASYASSSSSAAAASYASAAAAAAYASAAAAAAYDASSSASSAYDASSAYAAYAAYAVAYDAAAYAASAAYAAAYDASASAAAYDAASAAYAASAAAAASASASAAAHKAAWATFDPAGLLKRLVVLERVDSEREGD